MAVWNILASFLWCKLNTTLQGAYVMAIIHLFFDGSTAFDLIWLSLATWIGLKPTKLPTLPSRFCRGRSERSHFAGWKRLGGVGIKWKPGVAFFFLNGKAGGWGKPLKRGLGNKYVFLWMIFWMILPWVFWSHGDVWRFLATWVNGRGGSKRSVAPGNGVWISNVWIFAEFLLTSRELKSWDI